MRSRGGTGSSCSFEGFKPTAPRIGEQRKQLLRDAVAAREAEGFTLLRFER